MQADIRLLIVCLRPVRKLKDPAGTHTLRLCPPESKDCSADTSE